MAHTELDLGERRAIEDMLNAKVPVSKIAAEIGRHRSTVYREIKRNGFEDEELPELNGYYGVVAQREASKRCARRRKLVRLEELRAHIIARIDRDNAATRSHSPREFLREQPVPAAHIDDGLIRLRINEVIRHAPSARDVPPLVSGFKQRSGGIVELKHDAIIPNPTD